MPTVEVRSRDERIGFGGNAKKEKKKEPPPTPEILSMIEALMPDSPASEYKAVGNACVQNGMYTASIKHYSAAIERDPENEVLYSNRSAAYLQSTLLSGPSSALKDANKCISLKPSWFKGYLRKGDALFAVEKYEEAADAYEECLQHDPGCATAKESKAICMATIQRQREAEAASREPPAPQAAAQHQQENSPPRKPPPRQTPLSAEEKKEVQEKLDADALLSSWSKDSTSSNKTCQKAKAVDLSTVERGAGSATKSAWMSSFRNKLQSHPEQAKSFEEKSVQRQMAGASYDYRTKTGGGTYSLSDGTDAVGRAILADAFAHEKGEARKW